MDFRYKSTLQKCFAHIPYGHKLNFILQRYVAKSIPRSERVFNLKLQEAKLHHTNFIRHNKLERSNNRYFEFGAGWDLIIPIAMKALGYEITCIDVRRLSHKSLINDTLHRIKVHGRKHDISAPNWSSLNSIKELSQKIGIDYLTPLDAKNTKLPDDSFSFISSTSVMEHIPSHDILAILGECYRLLLPGGILSVVIDYQDHWSYFDSSISIYNFLQYSDKQWPRYNSSINYQNRLRHSDYLRLIEKTCFEIVQCNTLSPPKNQEEILQSLKLDNHFMDYSFDDLKISASTIVLRKPVLCANNLS